MVSTTYLPSFIMSDALKLTLPTLCFFLIVSQEQQETVGRHCVVEVVVFFTLNIIETSCRSTNALLVLRGLR